MLHLATTLLGLPLALDGEAAGSDNTALAVIALVSMVFGYVLLACLWHFVFRDRARARRDPDTSAAADASTPPVRPPPPVRSRRRR